ncbi:MAG TPA: NUDIX hydrolase, partial [Candidatus Eisenbacteria bacterium]
MSRFTATGPSRGPSRPRHAAAVILLRNPLDPEIFWVRRQPHLAFLGGFHSFPGGRMGKEDDPALLGMTGEATEAEQLDASLRLCALRELHEETGVSLRDPIASGVAFLDAVRNGAHRVPVEALVPAGRWVTPPFSPARFDTTFYLAWIPERVEPVVHDSELTDGEWIRPDAALDRWSAGKALLAPPALY